MADRVAEAWSDLQRSPEAQVAARRVELECQVEETSAVRFDDFVAYWQPGQVAAESDPTPSALLFSPSAGAAAHYIADQLARAEALRADALFLGPPRHFHVNCGWVLPEPPPLPWWERILNWGGPLRLLIGLHRVDRRRAYGR